VTRPRVLIPEVEWEPSHALLADIAEVVLGDPDVKYSDPHVLADAIESFDAVIITSQHRLGAEALDRGRTLKVIAKYGSFPGDHVDLEAATRNGVVVCFTRGANSESVAEHTIALILAGLKRIPQTDAMMRRGAWRDLSRLGSELRGRNVGVIGFGICGRAVVRKLQGFEVDVLVHDPYVACEEISQAGAIAVDLDDLLRRSDIVSIHAARTTETVHLIGEKELRRMKPSALLVNTARGVLVDEASLIDALRAGQIASAALDVFEREPLPSDSPLLAMENVIATPHLASSTNEAYEREATMAAQAVVDVLQGRKPECVANPAVLESNPPSEREN